MKLTLGPAIVMTPGLDEAERFYRDVLSLALVRRSDGQLIFDLEGRPLHVFRCARPASPAEHGSDASSVLTFEVASLDDTMRELKARGVAFLHDRPAHNREAGLAYAAFHAPGGNVHELVQRLPPVV